jgi:hypothetical protein
MRCRPRHRDGNIFLCAVLTRLVAAITLSAYLLNQFALKPSGHPFFVGYFNDVLAGGLLMALSNAMAGETNPIAQWIGSIWGTIMILAFASFSWEVLAPLLLADSQSDPLDIVAYYAGGFLFILSRYLILHSGRNRSLG